MNEEKDIALLVSYLEGTLSMDDKNALEERLLQEQDLQLLLHDLRLLKAGIKQANREEIRSELKALENKLAGSTSSASLLQSTWLKIAASLAIVAVSTWLLWPATKTPEQLFAENYEPYPNVIMPTVRGGQAPDSTVMAQAYKAYDMQEYSKAIELFESMEEKDEGVLLYLGNSYLANGLAEKAIPVFEKVISEFEIFDEQAEWYLSLSYIKIRDNENAKSVLLKLNAKDGFYKSRAETLLNHLKP